MNAFFNASARMLVGLTLCLAAVSTLAVVLAGAA